MFVIDFFLILLICNHAKPYFVVGETFGFSSMQEPSWSSSFGNNDLPEELPNEQLDDVPDIPTTRLTTTLLPLLLTTAATTIATKPPITTMPSSTKLLTTRRAVQEEEEAPNVDRREEGTDRSQIVNTILVFKNIVRVIQSDVNEVRRTCEMCSLSKADDTGNTCESSKAADSKIKQQLRDMKGFVKNIDATLLLLSNTINTIGAHMSGIQPRDCMDMFTRGQSASGVFYIQPTGADRPILTYCDMSDGGGWTIIQRRHEEDVDFDRGWGSYRRGFGEPNYSHWLGLDNIYTLLLQDEYQLRIELELYDDRRELAYYSYFKIGNAASNYKLAIGNFNGTAGDAMSFHNGLPFTTRDRDYDNAHGHNCATVYKGGWWYGDCFRANLNGLNIGKEETGSSGLGIIWYDLTGFHSSLRYVTMSVRPTY